MEELTIFRAVLTVVIVLVMAWWCSRLLGKQWAVRTAGSGNIELIEQLQVGQDRRILLMKVGEKHFLVGVSPAGIQLLSEVEGDFKAPKPPEMPSGTQLPFREFLKQHRDKWEGKR
ncbi:MAG: flagellar biosynthetic protein FliO [Lachnospiraceae bacterium]|nr:flagellar biosynthetic protein FliO [Lachnospiraceae bacterium]